MKNKKFIVASIVVISIILILLVCEIQYKTVSTIINRIKGEGTRDIAFEVYSNQDNKLKLLVKATDTENGITQIKYFNKEGEEFRIDTLNKTTVAFDYEIEKDGEYEFIAVNGVGDEIKKTLKIDEDYRNSLIGIEIKTERPLTTTGQVTIDYHGNENKNRMYKIGKNGTWTNYEGTFKLDSYDIIKNNLQDIDTKTITIYTKIQDNAGNIVEISKQVTNLDVDIAKEPRINYIGKDRYPVLGTQGTLLDEDIRVKIEFDSRDDIRNYYSIDNGKTWNLYTGEIATKNTNIIAKSIKIESELEVVKQENCNNILKSDALLAEGYDYDINSFAIALNKNIELEDNLKDKYLKVRLTCPPWNHIFVIFYEADKTTKVGETGYWHTNNGTGDLYLTIPENAKWVRFETVQGYADVAYIYDVTIQDTNNL